MGDPDEQVPRAGIVGPGANSRPELRVQQVLSRYGPPLEYHPLEVAAGNAGWFEDLLEFLPKARFVGVEVLGPFRNHSAIRSDWHPTADEAGCVDTLVFPTSDNRLAVGHNVTTTAVERLLLRADPDTNGLSVLVLGAGTTARSVLGALIRLEVDRVVVFDPTPDRADRLLENALGSGIDPRRVGTATNLEQAAAEVDAVVDCLPSGKGHELWASLDTATLPNYRWSVWDFRPSGGDRRPSAEVVVDRLSMCVERTACARELFTDSILPVEATRVALLDLVEG